MSTLHIQLIESMIRKCAKCKEKWMVCARPEGLDMDERAPMDSCFRIQLQNGMGNPHNNAHISIVCVRVCAHCPS